MVMLCFYNNNNCSGSFVCNYSPLNRCNFRTEYNVSDEFVDCVIPNDTSVQYGYFTQRTYYGHDECRAGDNFTEMTVMANECVQGEIALCWP